MARRTSEATTRLRVDLVDHARALVRREGASALTMRNLAHEAGCAVGLPYKVFANREDLVIDVAVSELGELGRTMTAWAAESADGPVSDGLIGYANILLGAATPTLNYAEMVDGDKLRARMAESDEVFVFFDSLERVVADYLAAEQVRGRVRPGIDTSAFGFMITGAIHNQLASAPGYPRPDAAVLSKYLRAIAAAIA